MKVRLIFESNDAALVVEADSDADKRLLESFMGSSNTHEAVLEVNRAPYPQSGVLSARAVIRPKLRDVVERSRTEA